MGNIITEAFERAPRAAFLPPDMRERAEEDRPLPIGYGQTISQPSTVRRMLEWLDVKKGHKVLDLGSGSGWTTALLGYLSSPLGYVWAVERVPELVEIGRRNCKKLDIDNTAFTQAGEHLGLRSEAPFDRILVGASARELPDELIDQLEPDGKMVIPVDDNIVVVKKELDDTMQTDIHPGFVFVPLVG